MPDQKINIDLSINPDALNQIPQLKTAIDNLKDSVSNLNKQVIIFNKQNEETVTWGTKIKSSVKDLSDTYESFNKMAGLAGKALKGWSGILAGAFTLVTTYGPDILDFFTDLFQSDKTREASRALKDYRDIMSSYVDKVSGGISKVQMLANVINSKETLYTNKVEALKKLKELAPDYLDKLTLENSKTKEGKKLLDDYLESLKRKAIEEATQEKRAIAVKGRYALKDDYDNAKKDYYMYLNHPEKNQPKTTYDPVAPGGGALTSTTRYPLDDAKNRFDTLVEQDRQLIKQINKYDSDFVTNLLKYTPKIVPETIQPTHHNNKPNPDKARPATEALEAKSIDFAQTIELDKQNYQTELALLGNQLKTKQITEEAYQQQSEQLQDKYHLAIGERIKVFNQIELADAQKHMEDLFTIQQHDDTMAKDEKALKKAILPGDRLEAEKNLVADKYNYEIALAAGNTEKIKQLEEQKQQDISAINKRYEQERKAFAMESAQKVSDTAFSMLKGSIQSQADAKIKSLETQKQAELSNSSLTATQKKAIEEKYKKKEAEEKVKAFKAEQRASILQAVINGALAITKATAQSGIFASFVIPGIIVSTALQVATIAKQKAPQYAKGGLHYQSDGRGALLAGYSRADDTNAYLRSGEAVVVSEAMRNPWARNLVSAINVAHGGRDFSVGNPGRGYAIGGIFTDGGNANRYYSQPANDAKDLANTLAYQMINNFPPIYVDVKDVNNQQNILAQTVNRVNL